MKKLMNDGWSFAKLPAGSTFSDAQRADFQPVDLPHDWLIWQEENLYETADAWYCRAIDLNELEGDVNYLSFDGVYMDCEVYINENKAYTHPYGYTPFFVPVEKKTLHEGKNRLTVHIRHQSPNSRWYSGSGIYRDVVLLSLPENHIIPDSLYLTEKKEDHRWTVNVSVEVSGGDEALTFTVLDADGKVAAAASGIRSGNTGRGRLVLGEGNEWSPENPYLYTLQIRYGKQTEVLKFGLRSICADPNNGFFLNGTKIKLHGVCLHHDLGALGAAFHEKAARRQLALMKKMGVNAIRTSHNPPACGFLDLCDEMGLLVIDEIFDMWERSKTTYDYARFFPEWAERDVASWIRRDRRHPCVIMWSIGNEIYDMHADARGAEITKFLAETVRRHDPDRHAFTTFGCNYMPWEGGQRCAAYVDIVGYNYGEKLYEEHHRMHPSWIIYGSETASVLSSRGIYHFPIERSIMSEEDCQCSSLGNSNTSWGATDLKKMIIDDTQNPYSLGQFVWSGIDYIGEPTPYHTRTCYFGQADTACFPKDSYYLFKSFWNDERMVHIGVSWDWNSGQMIDVPVMTNCRSVELLLNGVSLGRKTADRNDPAACAPRWKIPFAPGRLEAIAYDESGITVCRDERFTPSETDRFLLEAEDAELLSDGWDMTFITVTAVDLSGHPVENACDEVKIEVRGGGCLLGVDNGDSTDDRGYKTDCRRLFSGKLLIMIGSTGEKEPVTVRVTGNRAGTAEITLPIRECALRKGNNRHQRVRSQEPSPFTGVRRIDIAAEGDAKIDPQNPECSFRYRVLPEDASYGRIRWQATNEAGIELPNVWIHEEKGRVTVRAEGDGICYLRGLCEEENGSVRVMSQIEFTVTGTGCPPLNAYSYLSAGLYDIHEGTIGAGNDKGIAFDSTAESMIGFSRIDFGTSGTDTLTADIFALNSDRYEIEMYDGDPGKGGKLIDRLVYEKPSIWNVYQSETWKLPEKLKGIRTICFRMHDKVHLKGFRFAKANSAYMLRTAAGADRISGDRFSVTGNSVTQIGNNVTLSWDDLDFGNGGDALLTIHGKSERPINSILVSITDRQHSETRQMADFTNNTGGEQSFQVTVPAGECVLSFIFLPGSAFDFDSFCFRKKENWTEGSE